MITGTFSGWNILAMPATPAFSQMEVSMNDSVSAAASPWTRQAQILDWQADWWDATASLPPMKLHDAQAWMAFFGECRGMSGAFLVGNPLIQAPLGLARGKPVVSGTPAARASSLVVGGFAPNINRQLRAGDYLQLGYRLYMSLEDVNSDASGSATVNIWPRLREVPNNGDPVILRYPKGLFRLADNKRTYSASVNKTFGFSMKLTEAL